MKFNQLTTNLSRYFSKSGSVSFWHTPIKFYDYDFSGLQGYYIDLTAKTHYQGPFSEGVPLLDYKGNIGLRFNPCAIAQYGLGWYLRYINGETEAQEHVKRCAKWLSDNLFPHDKKTLFWQYDFDLSAYNVKAPWASALAQGQGISLLLRYYLMTKDEQYLEKSRLALNGMLLPIEQGGLLYRDGHQIYFEEVVSDRLTAILDGMIFSIFGVFDYYFVTKDSQIKKTLDEALLTIAEILPKYDLGYWSRADLYSQKPPMIASHFYHNLHVEQLKALYKLTHTKVFDDYSRKWDQYQKSRYLSCRAFIQKSYFKLTRY